MIWYLLMCFSGSSGTHCYGIQAPSYEACVQVLPMMKYYAAQRKFPVELDCITTTQYV